MPTDAALPQTYWYGIYLKDAKIGHAYIRMGTTGPNGATVDPATSGDPCADTPGATSTAAEAGLSGQYYVDMDMELQARSMGKPVTLKTRERLRFSAVAPHALVCGESASGNGQRTVARRRADGTFTVHTSSSGGSSSLKAPDLDITFSDYYTPTLWFQTPRAPGDTLTVRTLNLGQMATGQETFTVLAQRKSLVHGVPATFYECRHESTATGISGTRVFMDDHGTMLSSVIGQNLELRHEPRELALARDEPRDLFVMGMVSVNRALGNPTQLAGLVMDARGPSAVSLQSGPRQTATPGTRGAKGIVRLSLGARFVNPTKATPDEIRDALAETPQFPLQNPLVQKIARIAVGAATTDLEKVHHLVAFVHRFLKKELRPNPVPPLDLLTDPVGDCTEHAELFTLLARASGIPARQVSGLYYMGDQARAFGGHAWNEVVVNGQWMEVDAIAGQMDPDPAHVRLAAGKRTGAELLAHMQGLRFSVVKTIPASTTPPSPGL
ncbi:MAG: transglutaminase domain-containing protein [Desulfovibrionaceae bacterium]|nr:transglutaminase domain-containing protein [Desulfovibrionaceae bacterium]